jgi:hypothetical protein
VVVEPRLQAVDVQLGSGLVAGDVLGDVLVDAIRGVARLLERDRSDRDEERRDDGEEDREHDEDGRRARHLESREVADERIERERDHAGSQEEEEDVAERRREQEREEERHGEDDQLDPPWNLDRRAGAGHRADRTVEPGERPAKTLLRSGQWRLRAPVTPRDFAPIDDVRRLGQGELPLGQSSWCSLS